MTNKNPGFVSNKSPEAQSQALDQPNAIAESLKRRRKKIALKKGIGPLETDDLGNPSPTPQTDDGE